MNTTHNWRRHEPFFECDRLCRPLYAAAPWSGLRPFVYDYLINIRPGRIVELGTHYGCSAFCMMQAMKDERLDTELTLIDTWEGDPYTIHDYRDDVFGFFRTVKDLCYSDCKVEIRRQLFSDAAWVFPPESIDLLHIDGSHRYKDIKRDFEDWYGKVAPDGTILIHDIETRQNGRLLGTGLYWCDITEQYPNTLEIPCSCGLGIVLKSDKNMVCLEEAVHDPSYRWLYEEQNEQIKAWLREGWFAAQGGRLPDARKL